jgi:hypothetical protein
MKFMDPPAEAQQSFKIAGLLGTEAAGIESAASTPVHQVVGRFRLRRVDRFPGLAARDRREPVGFTPGRTSKFSSKNLRTKVIAFIRESTGPMPKIGLIRGRV